MKVFDFPFPIEIGSVCDLDFTSTGLPISIQGTGNRQVVMWDDRRLNLPEDWSAPEFPFIRALPDGRAVVIDSGFEAGKGKNAWILDREGKIESNFEVGSAAVEIAGLWGMVAVAYHPISAKAFGFPVQPLQRTGIAFFDYQGRMVMGFNQEAASIGLTVENVRCMTALSRSQILFIPEKAMLQGQEIENPAILFDCAAPRRPTVFSLPYPRSEAVAMADGLIHMASPEGWEDQIITFDVARKISQHRGEFLGIFRGLEGGGFLAQLSSADYAVVMPETPETVQPSKIEPNPGLQSGGGVLVEQSPLT